MGARMTIYLPDALARRLEREMPADVSLSKVCQDALVAKLDEVDQAKAERGEAVAAR